MISLNLKEYLIYEMYTHSTLPKTCRTIAPELLGLAIHAGTFSERSRYTGEYTDLNPYCKRLKILRHIIQLALIIDQNHFLIISI